MNWVERSQAYRLELPGLILRHLALGFCLILYLDLLDYFLGDVPPSLGLSLSVLPFLFSFEVRDGGAAPSFVRVNDGRILGTIAFVCIRFQIIASSYVIAV